MALSGALVLGLSPFGADRYQSVPGAPGLTGLRRLPAKEAAVLAAVARRVLDGSGGAGGVDVGAILRFADGYLGHLDGALVSDLRALLLLVEHSPLLAGHGARFTALPPAAQDEVLRAWQGSGLALRRQGFQALKSLCCLAHYQDGRSYGAIGYPGALL